MRNVKDYISTRVFDGIRILSKEEADRLRKIVKERKMSDENTQIVYHTKYAADCGCGRSPTGKCIGWHKLTNEQYSAKLQEYEKKQLTEEAPQFLRD